MKDRRIGKRGIRSKMPVAGGIDNIPDYANCEVARINCAYKDDEEGVNQGSDSLFSCL